MKLLIATPSYDPTVCIQTYSAMLELDRCGMEVESFNPEGYTVEMARTMAADRALEAGADWLLFVDSDVVPPSDALANMLEHDADVCFGYYLASRGHGEETCLFEPGGDQYDRCYTKMHLHLLRDGGTRKVEVRGGGLGFALVRASVFGRIREPWFRFSWDRDSRKKRLSEDLHFCTRCREAGIALIGDTRADCGHVRNTVV